MGGGLEAAGVVLSVGLAAGIGGPSVVDLSMALLLVFLGRAIRTPGPLHGVLSWLSISLALGAVAVRWGSPSLDVIQGAQGVLGVGVGEDLVVVGLFLAGVSAFSGLAHWLTPVPQELEERIAILLGGLAGGLCLAVAFLGQAGRELMVLGLGALVGLSAIGLAWLLEKLPRRATDRIPLAAAVVAAVAAGLVGSAL